MVHSIELLLDEASEQWVDRQWQALAAAGLPSEHRPAAQRPGGTTPRRPHLTLVACAAIAPEEVDRAAAVVAGALPLPVVIGSPMIFGRATSRRPDLILVRQVVASAALLELQHQVRAVCPPPVDRHFDDGRWAPHITLARRLRPDQLGEAIGALGESVGRAEREATVVGCRYWRGDLKQAVTLCGPEDA